MRRWRLALAALLYSAILIAGSIPGARAEIGEFASGLALHSTAYAVLTFLLVTGLEGTRSRRTLLAVLAIALMGALDEVIQSFLPYRHGAAGDWLVDFSAALVTSAILWVAYPAQVGERRN